MRAVFAAALLASASLAAVSALAQSVTSAVTKLDLDKCRHIAGKAEEDYGEWRCAASAGFPSTSAPAISASV
jgi:uncharacterized low-complexity protein